MAGGGGTPAAASEDGSDDVNANSSSNKESKMGGSMIAVIIMAALAVIGIVVGILKWRSGGGDPQPLRPNAASPAHARGGAGEAKYEVAVRDNPNYAPGDGMDLVRASSYEMAVVENPEYSQGEGMALVRASSTSISIGGGSGSSGGAGKRSGERSSDDAVATPPVVYAVPMERIQLDAGGYVDDCTISTQQRGASAAVYATPRALEGGGVEGAMGSESSV